ncbi:hypothetical protein [Glaciibacter psychrotolerans]|uniref:Uncharacterized protein n=1 Tax=Glaciibacter psychrotolerans TaxID=670054 RepID=A0A7Z0EGZ5_9MICO|nr:hypothetical protein [Leifsonia psychrotolerans]NYJ21453.1 hypothetical protein [Leifsonia psychrotolerans]
MRDETNSTNEGATRASLSAPGVIREDGLSDFVQVGPLKPDLWLPQLLHGTVELPDLPGIAFELDLLTLDAREGYRLHSMTMRSDDRITTAQVHKISLPKLLHALAAADPFVVLAAQRGSEERKKRAEQSTGGGLLDRQSLAAAAVGPNGPTEEMLMWVARTFAWCKAVGGNPGLAVQETLGLPQRTATRWIARARANGLLE